VYNYIILCTCRKAVICPEMGLVRNALTQPDPQFKRLNPTRPDLTRRDPWMDRIRVHFRTGPAISVRLFDWSLF